jgi:hypothetical protein
MSSLQKMIPTSSIIIFFEIKASIQLYVKTVCRRRNGNEAGSLCLPLEKPGRWLPSLYSCQ